MVKIRLLIVQKPRVASDLVPSPESVPSCNPSKNQVLCQAACYSKIEIQKANHHALHHRIRDVVVTTSLYFVLFFPIVIILSPVICLGESFQELALKLP